MSGTENLKKRYEDKWVPSKYLEAYCNSDLPFEIFLVSKFHEAIESGKLKGPRGIDIGCGPTVHRMAQLSRVCDNILACDYTPSNLDLVKKWWNSDLQSAEITESLKIGSQLEGFKNIEEGEKAMSERLRSKLKHVVQCDLTNTESVSKLLEYGGQFDCAHSSGCLESACLNYETFVDVLKRIATLLKPGAAFALGCYKCDFYFVDGVRYECFGWTEDLVRLGLTEAGFEVESIQSSEKSQLGDMCNCKNVFFCLSHKSK